LNKQEFESLIKTWKKIAIDYSNELIEDQCMLEEQFEEAQRKLTNIMGMQKSVNRKLNNSEQFIDNLNKLKKDLKKGIE